MLGGNENERSQERTEQEKLRFNPTAEQNLTSRKRQQRSFRR